MENRPPPSCQTKESLKSELRQRVAHSLAGIEPLQKMAASKEACVLLERQPAWRRAKSVLIYAPIAGELDIWPLLATALLSRKLVALPKYLAATRNYAAFEIKHPEADIELGKFGIREPGQSCIEVKLNDLDLVLVPGLAFDLHGRRLGRGKGYYDRFLKAVRGTTCGVAFEEQIVREVPVEPHDVHLNCILTPKRWLEL